MSIYSLGIFLGAGAAYFIGGAVAGALAVNETWHVPVIGSIYPWQAVFPAVGLPGLLIALMFFTIREPARQEVAAGVQPPVSALLHYVAANRRTFVAQTLGFACSALVNISLASWLAEFFIRTHGWTRHEAGRTQGLLTMIVGTTGVIAGGWVADWFVKRGHVNGPLRVGMIGALGMLVSATAYPLMPTATLAVSWLVIVNIFAALPWGAASAAAAEVVPAPLRAQGVAVYFFVVGLISRTGGPTAVAMLNDRAFRGADGIRYSLAVVNVVGMTLALAFFTLGLGAYGKTIASRERWEEGRVRGN